MITGGKWENFPSPEFGTKFHKEVVLLQTVPALPYNTR